MDIVSYVLGYKSGAKGGGSGGGNSGEDGCYWKVEKTLPNGTNMVNSSFIFDNKLHIFFRNPTTSVYEIWVLNEDTWVQLCNTPSVTYAGFNSFVEFNGELHLLGGEASVHYKYTDGGWVKVSDLPTKNHHFRSACVLNGELYAFLGSTGKELYKYDGNQWTLVFTCSDSFLGGCFVFEDKIYANRDGLFCYSNGVGNTVATTPTGMNISARQFVTDGANIYCVMNQPNMPIFKLTDNQLVETGLVSICHSNTAVTQIFDNRIHCPGQSNGTYNYSIHLSCAVPS